MAAWVGPALGAVASYLGSSKASDESSKVAKENAKIARENFEAQQQAREETIDFARELFGQRELGVTDASGNRTYFDPERGWVTDLSPIQQQILQAVEAEQLRQATDGLARAEQSESRMSGLAADAGIRAEQMGREFDSIRRRDPSEIENLLLASGAAARNQQQDAQYRNITRDLLRTGNQGSIGRVMAERAERDAAAAQDRGIEARLRAMDFVDKDFDRRRANTSSLLDEFSRQASYTPQVNARTATGPQADKSGQSYLFQALSSNPAQMNFQSPDFSAANKWYDLGTSISSAAQTITGNNQTDKLIEMMSAG